MKNAFRLSLIMALLVALFAGVSSGSAALVSYNSGFQVQNLENAPASITISFIDRQGTTILAVQDTVAASSSNTYFPLENLGGNQNNDVPAGFDGSVVISSDKEVAAITNVAGSDGSDPNAFGASYSGFTGGSPNVSIPLLMAANYGFDTWFSVQNVGGANTDITVTYSDGKTATATGVKPGAAAKFEQAKEGHVTRWVGSATVASTASDIALTVLEVGPTTLFAYNGFGAGSPSPVFPLINMNNTGYQTGIQLQNTGNTATDVTVTYTPGPAPLGKGTACTETRTVPANQSVSFALYIFTPFADPAPTSLKSENCNVNETFIGSARVTANSAGVNLVGIVNQLTFNNTNKGAAYNAFNPAAGTATVVFPLIMDRNYGYVTGWNLVNVGGAAIPAGGVVCTVTGRDVNNAVVTKTFTTEELSVGEGWNELNANKLADRFVGSATCVGPAGSKMVGSVNELRFGALGATADTLLVYEGTNR